MPISPPKRRLAGGVELVAPSTADFRVWAPACRRVEFVIDGGASHELTRGGDDGSFEGIVSGVGAETRYWFRLDRGRLRPDPVSRYQPYGPHGPSAIVDAASFEWTDDAWKGVGATGHVLYEMHIGTFTPEGSWAAAEDQLEWLGGRGARLAESGGGG